MNESECVNRKQVFVFIVTLVTFDPSRCSRQEACDKWEEPQHFNNRLDQCVTVSVTPSNMSVTSPATQVDTHTLVVLWL